MDSRFKAKEFEPHNVKDIRIKRIQRIHNRFLRVKFEERLSRFSDNTTGNPNKQLEFIFYGEDPQFPKEIYRILEEGYRNTDVTFNPSPKECENIGLSPYPPFTNQMLATDMPRIKHFYNKMEKSDSGRYDPNCRKENYIIPNGHLIICKVLITDSMRDTMCPVFDLGDSPSEIFKKDPPPTSKGKL